MHYIVILKIIKYGGIITIVDANQKSSKVKQIDKNAEIIMYEPNDYVDVKNISDLIHNYKNDKRRI